MGDNLEEVLMQALLPPSLRLPLKMVVEVEKVQLNIEIIFISLS